MIKTEIITADDGIELIRTYSDEGYEIIQNETGTIYEEAIDIQPLAYTYTETDEPIGSEIEEAQGDDNDYENLPM